MRVAFETSELYFTGLVVAGHLDGASITLKLDDEYAEDLPSNNLVRVNPDYCTEIPVPGSTLAKARAVAEAQRYITVHKQLVEQATKKLATAKARLQVMEDNLTEKLEQL